MRDGINLYHALRCYLTRRLRSICFIEACIRVTMPITCTLSPSGWFGFGGNENRLLMARIVRVGTEFVPAQNLVPSLCRALVRLPVEQAPLDDHEIILTRPSARLADVDASEDGAIGGGLI